MKNRNSKKMTTILLLVGFTVFLISSCTKSNSKNIYISTPLTGGKEKGKKIVNAIKLFQTEHPELSLEIKLFDSKSNDYLSAKQTFEFLFINQPNKIIFGPPGSIGSELLLDMIKKNHKPIKKNTFLVNQVSASSKINYFFPQVSTFFKSEDYLAGVVDFLLSHHKLPKKIHLFSQANTPYLQEVAQELKNEILSRKLKIGLEIKFPQQDASIILKSLNVKNVDKDDWFFIISHNSPSAFENFQKNSIFKNTLKIYTYGRDHSNSTTHPWMYTNSYQAFFWHPELEYAKYGKTSNCDFEKNYVTVFKQKPDFHSAFIYTTLEALSAINFENPFQRGLGSIGLSSIPSITGEVLWNDIGLRLSMKPILVFQGNHQNQIYLPDTVSKVCDSAKLLKNYDVKRWK